MLPVLFHLPGGRPVFAYGAALGLALLLAFLWTMARGKTRSSLGRDRAGNAALLTIAVALLGSRLTYAWLNPELIEEAGGAWWKIQAGGLSGMGGLLLGLAAAVLYLRVVAPIASIPEFGDACAPALGLVQALTALGAYLFGSEFGVRLAEDAPGFLQALGTYPRWELGDMYGPPVLVYHVERYYLAPDVSASLPVQPVQLYGVVVGLLAIGLARIRDRSAPLTGGVFMPVALFLLGAKFLLEYLRADPDRGLFFGFSLSQLICLLMMPLLWLAWQQWRRDLTAAGSL